jgi:hypothetical protein
VKMRHLVPLGAILAYFAAGLAWLGGARGHDEDVFAPGSVFERSEQGASLAFEYLRRRGFPVSVRAAPLDAASVPADATVFRLRPRHEEAERDRNDVVVRRPALSVGDQEWLAAGGRLVIALDRRYGALDVEPVSGRETAPAKVFPIWPGVRAVHVTTARRLVAVGLPEGAITLFTIGDAPWIARWPVGRGEVIALACPEAFENAGLAMGDHVALLESLAGRGRPLLFDESVHGLESDRGLATLLLEWRLGPALVAAALALLLALWRSRARLGPAEGDVDLTHARSDAVDLVDSLALLYSRALGRGELLALYYEGLRRRVALRTGLKGEALDARLALLTGALEAPSPTHEPTRGEFERTLQALNRAFDTMEDHAHTR